MKLNPGGIIINYRFCVNKIFVDQKNVDETNKFVDENKYWFCDVTFCGFVFKVEGAVPLPHPPRWEMAGMSTK